jgi:hypothetical protein
VQSAKPTSSRLYRRRQPEKTVLYRALAQYFETFLQVYEERFQPTFGFFRKVIQDTVYKFLDCGIFDRGFGRARCPKCKYEFLVALSCKLRCICPSCHQKRELLWADWAGEELLEQVPHRQVVFTIPKRLRVFFRYDRRLLGDLAACAWRAIRLYFKVYYDGHPILPGAVGFIATAGEFLNWQPHIHVLLTDGGFLPDGTFRHLLYFDSNKVEKLFRAEVLRLLLKKQLITEQAVNNMLSWRSSGFSAHASVRADTIKDAVQLGRYMIRCPLVLKRLQWDEEQGEVVYAARPTRATGAFGGVVRWDVLEFIARVTDHIPEHGQQFVRNWGYYSNASRGKRRRRSELESPSAQEATDLAEQDADGWRRRRRLTWVKLLQKVYEIDPLLCRFCGTEMKIISFITEYPVIKKILTHIKFESQQPEPLAHSPPLFQDTVYVPF